MIKNFKILKYIFIFLFLIITNKSYSDIVNEIKINGNDRISEETIKMFTNIKINDEVNVQDLNLILKRLYDSNFFEDVKIKFNDNVLEILVLELPIIQNINYEGVNSQSLRNNIFNNLLLKPRSSFNKSFLDQDKKLILNNLKNLGYYFSNLDIFIEEIDNKLVNITYKVDLGEKARIKRITFIGNKIFKNRKLRSIILSEEYKFWKFVSGKKYLNENLISLDNRLLKNFYLNNGYYNVVINSSFGKLINENEFELIYNIDAKEKVFFNNLTLELPNDFDKNNFLSLENLFSDLKNKPYSLNQIEKITNEINNINVKEQFENLNASVDETLNNNKLDIVFKIEETKKIYVQKINIYGNNVTRESVIRNQLEVDEGDPFNEILYTKSINNLKSLNFFKTVNTDVSSGDLPNSKIIDVIVEEKATGEIFAGAGFGTNGGTVAFGVKENNYLGQGISIDSNISVNSESIKGLFTVTNPNFNNTDKSIFASLQALETDRLSTFGYKSNKAGFAIGTNFEYLDDFILGIASSNFYEKIETDNSASVRQQAQKGNYWDTFLKLDFDYDKRNQKFQTSDGFRSFYSLDLPIISENNTLTNTYDFRTFSELYNNNITSFSLFLQSASSISGDNIKLSERLFIPSNKLRGFERGKIGPKDGEDYIGGNYITAMNLTTTLPVLFENVQNIDFSVFFDAANLWGVDYNSSLDDGSQIRSSIGIAVDWFTPIGPLNFSLSQPITEKSSDVTETFRFNLGTSF